MLAHRAASQEKDGDVAASDGEQQSYCSEQEIQGATEIMNEIVVQADNIELEMLAGEMLGRFLGELVDQRSQGGVRHFMGDTGLQAKADIVRPDGIEGNLEGKIDVAVIPGEA